MNVYNLKLVRKNEIKVLPINMTYFLFTVDMLFSFVFFHNADVWIFAITTALFNYIFIQDKYLFVF